MLIEKGMLLYGSFADSRAKNKNIPMLIEITDSDGRSFIGTSTYRQGRVKIKGQVEGFNIFFTEYEALTKNILVPSYYSGKVFNDSICGVAQYADIFGTFYLEKQK